MAADLTIEILRAEAWPAAMELSARAFFDEPYAHELFGADPMERFAGIPALYASGSRHEQDGWVSRVAVEPALRGQGIGRRVMAAAVTGPDAHLMRSDP